MSLPPLPPDSTYSTLTNGYFGNLSAENQNVLWQAFLVKEGLDTNPPETVENLTKYSEYIADVYESDLNKGTLLDVKTQFIWSIFDILILLMSKLVKSQLNAQAAAEFLLKYQKSYQDEMSKVFFYTGGPMSSAYPIDSPDAGRTPTSQTPENIDTFTLGYGSLTVADYFKYLYQKAKDGAQGEEFTQRIYSKPPSTSTTDLRYMELSCVRGDNNFYTVTVKTVDTATGYQTTQSRGVQVPTEANYDLLKAAAQQIFASSYAAVKAQISNFELFVPWQDNILMNYVGDDSRGQALNAKMVSIRNERNRRINNFLDSLKTKRDVLGEKEDQQNRIMESSTTARKQSSNILQTIIRQLQTILGAIYR